MAYERIDDSPQFDGECRNSHEARYRIASGFTEDEDTILDAGCGVGYGLKFFDKHHQAYIGLDKNPPDRPVFLKADFETGEGLDSERLGDFDVFVGLEIIEHLNDDGVINFVHMAKKAKKWIVISTPIVPNSNPFHKQQFTELDLKQLFLLDLNKNEWRHYETFYQRDGRYGVFIFKKAI